MNLEADSKQVVRTEAMLWDEARELVESALPEYDPSLAAVASDRGSNFERALTIGRKLWGDARGIVRDKPEIAAPHGARYFALKGSGSNHCCFDGTVYDREDEERGADGNFISFGIVCECFDMETAERVATALNASIEAASDTNLGSKEANERV